MSKIKLVTRAIQALFQLTVSVVFDHPWHYPRVWKNYKTYLWESVLYGDSAAIPQPSRDFQQALVRLALRAVGKS